VEYSVLGFLLTFVIGMIRSCTTCGEVVEQGKNACRNCSRPCGMPHCTICRLPVKGHYNRPYSVVIVPLTSTDRTLAQLSALLPRYAHLVLEAP
jgi:predicted amidophosphoribosyltransferase